MALITSAYRPVTGRLRPTPNTASITTVYSSRGISVTICTPRFPAISLCILHSSLMDASLPTNTAHTLFPSICKSLATANPSPPLFPLPHTTRHCSRAICLSFITSTVFRAARSISTSDGIPILCIVSSSAFCIHVPFGKYLMIFHPFL